LRWQEWVLDAPVVVVFVGVVSRLAARYGARAERYVLLEAGAAAENVHLQATAARLASVLVGSFDARLVSSILGLRAGEEPLGLMPVGTPRYRLY
jgi:SagB-type dehydrogenase family enzyme